MILCESRSLAGVLDRIAAGFACPLASTNGFCKGFLSSTGLPALRVDQRVLYLGDLDYSGGQIEEHTKSVLAERIPLSRAGARVLLLRNWERLMLTDEQVERERLPVISKYDRRTKSYHDAVETEALGQKFIVDAVRTRLDELMPEPIADVLERQERQRAEVAARLREMRL